MNRKWLTEVLRDETKSAFVLFSVTTATLLMVFSPLSSSLFDFANSQINLGFANTDLRSFASEYLLAIFFLIAGIELRYELTIGSLNTFKSASVPVMAAVGGMAVPALIYLTLSQSDAAWGAPMATDLPFALGVIAIFGKRLSFEVRAFLLALAIVDDALSVLVITFGLGHSSIHPTFIAVLIGLALPTRNNFADKVRHLLQPFSSGVALPLFAITALAIPIEISSLLNDETGAISAARLIGKPLGVTIGALLAVVVFRSRASIKTSEIFVVGCVASVGFSVSLLFVNLSGLSPAQLIDTTAAVIVAIPLCAALGAMASSMPKDPSRK
jgi:NhaA family Na+:H+ antiporter